ncbi:Plasmid replication protein [Streptococcus equi subsp. equi]|uniref:Plasmid replication protein n=2 Tax=Streptococcus equi TaxID=1336 RepID=A0A380JLM9_9STRE|nr:Plasmid replication protein [Streptococcus equi subsp. equi]
MAISPLHDKDKSSVEGQEYKKAHYHVLYIAKNPVTVDSVRKKIKLLLGEKSLAMVQIVLNVENMYLYLTHESKDAIEKKKHVYDKADIKLLNNFDIDRYVVVDEYEKEELFNVICDIVVEYQLANLLELDKFVKRYGRNYGLVGMKQVNKIIAPKSGLMRLYFDGAYQVRKNGLVEIELPEDAVDSETGEILSEKD